MWPLVTPKGICTGARSTLTPAVLAPESLRAVTDKPLGASGPLAVALNSSQLCDAFPQRT